VGYVGIMKKIKTFGTAAIFASSPALGWLPSIPGGIPCMYIARRNFWEAEPSAT